MPRLNGDILHFFLKQGFVIVTTIDRDGSLHNSCKGIVKISQNGQIYLLDLYRGKTYDNLKHNSRISITAVNEHKFKGYCLKGKAKIVAGDKLKPQIIQGWEERVTGRITQRLIRNIHEEKGHPRHPESLLPKPEYLIVMEVEGVIDLTPHNLK